MFNASVERARLSNGTDAAFMAGRMLNKSDREGERLHGGNQEAGTDRAPLAPFRRWRGRPSCHAI